ncbi:unnamed protein product [Microthlaspi erraticum]|uniref:Uncharacterized protein n=1 Tax=Microthlaspi erraticum TaxID=1685480 RepID=A0A6D2KLB6_9BRAS|nr:unnamed protein product [Microthlaspi erraticum]
MEGYHPELKVILDDGNYTYWKAGREQIFNSTGTDHGSCSKKQFELIQGCTKSKEAWDILQIHFEGTSQVQSSRKDLLATKFENMRMEEHESIADFSSKLSSLVQESRTLGKVYKDAKLVKKLLRCLPDKFTAYKAGLSANPIFEDDHYDEMVGNCSYTNWN